MLDSGKFDEVISSDLFSDIESECNNKEPVSLEEKISMKFLFTRVMVKIEKEKKEAARGIRPPGKSGFKIKEWWVYAAVVIFGIVYALVMLPKELTGVDKLIAALKPKSDMYYAFSGKQFIVLPDGTTVTLNDSSRLGYHESFGKNGVREIILFGEAYFDVKHNPDKPFIVRTSTVTTEVLGTAFNVTAYPGQARVVVTVARGSVQVINEMRRVNVLNQNEQIVVNTLTSQFVKTTVDLRKELKWKENFLIIDRVTLKEAVDMIAKKYGVKVTIVNEKMKDCIVSSTFMNNEGLEDVLNIMSVLVQGDYRIQGKHVYLDGKGCTIPYRTTY